MTHIQVYLGKSVTDNMTLTAYMTNQIPLSWSISLVKDASIG